VICVPSVEWNGQSISSTRIRQALQEGDVRLAAELLGRHYELQGPVVHGKQLGRTIGFPTLNVQVPEECLFPRKGVYCGYAAIEGEKGLYSCISNIGTKPTVNGTVLCLESYLLGYAGDAYGRQARIDFRHFLRPEQKFDSLDALKAQITADKEAAVHFLK